MGAALNVPDADENMKKAIVLANLTPREVRGFFKIFRKFDKDRKGLIKLSELFESMEECRTVFTDSLLDLLEIEHDGRLNFSDFLLMVVTYCLFEPIEILKFCFFVFDQDKHGFFEQTELKMLLHILHGVKTGDTVKGNIKVSWQNMKFSEDDRVEFEELLTFHQQFPRLFQPAFKLQLNMMLYIKGNRWWSLKKSALQKLKDESKAKLEKDKISQESRARKAAERKLRRKMGLIRYFCCPCLRFMFIEVEPTVNPIEDDEKKKKALAIQEAKRQYELKLKNPETPAWKIYENKKAQALEGLREGNVEVLDTADRVQRKRKERTENRKSRRENRKLDEDLK